MNKENCNLIVKSILLLATDDVRFNSPSSHDADLPLLGLHLFTISHQKLIPLHTKWIGGAHCNSMSGEKNIIKNHNPVESVGTFSSVKHPSLSLLVEFNSKIFHDCVKKKRVVERNCWTSRNFALPQDERHTSCFMVRYVMCVRRDIIALVRQVLVNDMWVYIQERSCWSQSHERVSL